MLRGRDAESSASLVSGPFRARPSAFVSPADAADLSLLVRWAADHGVALTPRGAGTGMPGGNLGPSVVVALGEGFGGIEPLAGRPGTFRAGAATVAAHLEAAARESGRFVPPLPSSARWCTLGGMAANNAAGARSFRHGPAAAWITALEGVDAAGEPFRVERRDRGSLSGTAHAWEEEDRPSHPEEASTAGSSRFDLPLPPLDLARGTDGRPAGWPRVRKNSSGYALDRFLPARDPLQLLVGSEGTLGILTALEWRTAPLPAERGVALLPADSPEDLVRIALAAPELGATACEFLGRRFLEMAGLVHDPEVGALARDAYALVLLEVDGAADEVRAGLDASRALGRSGAGPGIATPSPERAARLWALRHAASPTIARRAGRGLISTQFIEDSVVPVGRLAEYLTGLDEILSDSGFDAVVFGHAGDGNVHVNPLVDTRSADWEARVRSTLEQVVDMVSRLGGTLAGEHGDGRLRAPFLERVWGPHLTDAFRRIKNHFDPEGILNPGVVLPTRGQDPLEGFVPRPRLHPRI